MKSKWNKYTIGDIVEINSESLKKGHSLTVIEYLDTSSVTENNFDNTEILDARNAPSRAKRMVQDQDIVISTVRPNLKHYGFIENPKSNLIVSTGFAVIRCKTELVEPRYMYYFLSLTSTTNYLSTIADGSTSTYPSIKPSVISELNISLPALPTQKKIAHILSTLDDKIELNRKMNQTLEEMAQALFKSWFVDFDPVHARVGCKTDDELESAAKEIGISKEVLELFPREFVESEMGMIPLGWEAKILKDFGRVVTGKTPPKKVEDAYNNIGKPFITPTDVDDSLFVTSTNRHLSESGENAIKNTVITAGSICVTCIGSQMGKTIISPYNACTNQQINSIIVNEKSIRNYLFFNLRSRKNEIFLMGSGGSTMPLLNKSSFEKMRVLMPDENILRSFNTLVKNKLELILKNDLQTITLAHMRDTLLPKLLSGELDVSEVQL